MAPLSAAKQENFGDDDPKAVKARRELQQANKAIMEMAKHEKIGIMRTRRQMQQERKEAFAEMRPVALSERPRTPGELGRAAAALAKRRGPSGNLLRVASNRTMGQRSSRASPVESECGGISRAVSRRDSRSNSPNKSASCSSPVSAAKSPKAEEKKVTMCSLRDVKWFHRSLVRQQVLKQKFEFLYRHMQDAEKRQAEADEDEEAWLKTAGAGEEDADPVVEPPEGVVEARRRLSTLENSFEMPLQDKHGLDGDSESCSSRPLSASASSYATSSAWTGKRSMPGRTSITWDESIPGSGDVSRRTSRPSSATEDGDDTPADPVGLSDRCAQAWMTKTSTAEADTKLPGTTEEPKSANRSQAQFPWRMTPTGPPQPLLRSASAQGKGRTRASSSVGQCSTAGMSSRRSSAVANQRSMRRSSSAASCKGSSACKGAGQSRLLSVSASVNQLAAELELEPVRKEYYGGDDCLLHEDILYSANPRLFPLKKGPAKPFPLLRLAEC